MLLSLIAEKPSHGYELIKAVETKLGGAYSPSPGVIYPSLTLLEEMGALESEAQGGKKLYSITGAGRAMLAENEEVLRAAEATMDKFALPRPAPGRHPRRRRPAAPRHPCAADGRGRPDRGPGREHRGHPERGRRQGGAGMSDTLRTPRRLRHEPEFRTLRVAEFQDLTPTLRRIVLEGADLDGFVSLGFDDHVKIFPVAEGQAPVLPTIGPTGRFSRAASGRARPAPRL